MIESKLAGLTARGIILTAAGTRLSVDAPVGSVTLEDREFLKASRAAIIAVLRRRNSVGKANPTAEWPASIGAACDFILLLAPKDLGTIAPRTEIFEFSHGVKIVDRRKFLSWLQSDVRRGPRGPRAICGAVQSDVQQLRDMLMLAAGGPTGSAAAGQVSAIRPPDDRPGLNGVVAAAAIVQSAGDPEAIGGLACIHAASTLF